MSRTPLKTVWMSRAEEDGSIAEVGLLRPTEWMSANGIYAEGDIVRLSMPEMGAEGEFEVTKIEESEIEGGVGGLVTGCFRFSRGVICDLRIEGESEVIGVTGLHPIWSEDRQGWVPAAELRVGERVQRVDGGTVELLESRLRPQVEPVYNIEVDADHCYRVGQQGILVHNVSQRCKLFSEKYFGGSFCSAGGPMNTLGPGNRVERSEARVCSTGQVRPSLQDPPGWNPAWNQGLPIGRSRVARCHLLGNQFGGSGNADNLVPCCQAANLEMAAVENMVAKFIEENGCVDIFVTADFAGKPISGIPKSITFTAKGQDINSNNKCTTFSITITNPDSLTRCRIA